MKHRFASHVCQTFFSIAVETISREVCFSLAARCSSDRPSLQTKGLSPQAVSETEDAGTLRTLTQLILDISDVSGLLRLNTPSCLW